MCNLFMEYYVYHSLEGGWWVGESEEHDCRFEQSLIGYESCFVPVLFDDLNYVVPPADIDCGD
jgi:hypothetical protein